MLGALTVASSEPSSANPTCCRAIFRSGIHGPHQDARHPGTTVARRTLVARGFTVLTRTLVARGPRSPRGSPSPGITAVNRILIDPLAASPFPVRATPDPDRRADFPGPDDFTFRSSLRLPRSGRLQIPIDVPPPPMRPSGDSVCSPSPWSSPRSALLSIFPLRFRGMASRTTTFCGTLCAGSRS
jgi:hypothetical protein